MALFVGVTLLSPLAVGLVTRVVRLADARRRRQVGAPSNAARNSRRTATTAAALMIGLTLVTTALVVGDSVKASMASTFERSAKADYYVTDELEEVEFPADAGRRDPCSRTPSTRRPGSPTSTPASTARSPAWPASTSIRSTTLLDVDVTQGSFATDVEYPAVVSADEAKTTGAKLGDTVDVESAAGGA